MQIKNLGIVVGSGGGIFKNAIQFKADNAAEEVFLLMILDEMGIMDHNKGLEKVVESWGFQRVSDWTHQYGPPMEPFSTGAYCLGLAVRRCEERVSEDFFGDKKFEKSLMEKSKPDEIEKLEIKNIEIMQVVEGIGFKNVVLIKAFSQRARTFIKRLKRTMYKLENNNRELQIMGYFYSKSNSRPTWLLLGIPVI